MPESEPILIIRMPATPAGEVLTRVAANALAVAVDRDDREGELRAGQDTPKWIEVRRAAPGQMLSFNLQQVERMLIAAYHDRRREEGAGLEARGPRLRIVTLEAKKARLLGELAEVDASARVRRDGPFRVSLPAVRAECHDGCLEWSGALELVRLSALELRDAYAWARGADRPRGRFPIYQLNARGSLTERGNVHPHHRDLFRARAPRPVVPGLALA